MATETNPITFSKWFKWGSFIGCNVILYSCCTSWLTDYPSDLLLLDNQIYTSSILNSPLIKKPGQYKNPYMQILEMTNW